MPQGGRPSAERYEPEDSTASYQLFVAAILRRAVHDAQGKIVGVEERAGRAAARSEAQTFLRNTAKVAYWAELVGADGATLQRALCREAHLDVPAVTP
jgi:hypothetical protein